MKGDVNLQSLCTPLAAICLGKFPDKEGSILFLAVVRFAAGGVKGAGWISKLWKHLATRDKLLHVLCPKCGRTM